MKFDVRTPQSWLEADALEDVAVSLSRMGELDQALSLVERIESPQSRDDVRLEIAYELIEKGLFEEAADVGGAEKFDKMSARMRRVLESSSIELNKVSLNKARAMAMEIPAQSEQREVFVAIARSFALMGELDLAMETACQVGAEDISRFEIAVAFATAPTEPEYPDKPVQRRLKQSFTEPEIALVNRFAEMMLAKPTRPSYWPTTQR
ncbi:hypothetical protein [Neorhodopirellula pilleata]|uniref:Tetratricopeptide repeat protein n=1 Tax=Neorhodopirellula pilleata TaxID=2714738 RepID=A0A5C6A8V0_9BACT|nr:hypothetical protein [Neorhodopirellula pilleata]TWT95745.1 hypothetical protein Pla100_33870 [Neorhodopirellula pilleata]